MSATRLQWKIYEAGFCRHPERATRAGAPLAACEFPALVFRLTHPRHGHLLFDTGYSRHFFRATDGFPERLYRWVTPVHLRTGASFAEQLQREGIAAGDIAWVLLSHLHGDHVGGVGDFAKARIGLARAAWDELCALGRVAALRRGLIPRLLDEDARRRLHFFEDCAAAALPAATAGFGQGRDLFGDGSVVIVPLPGHARGHVGLLFEDAEGPVLLVADAAWSSAAIRDNVPPPALVTAWLGDTARYRDTLAKLQALQRAQPALRIVPSHCREWRPAAAPR
ncbi:MBL fold metallo-hydrolase [Arenimonas composti]|uniref:Metallo-beta-lactamase domain-containing protein n=1 Tax=Arenimonas composti TR7-09 = DSM 18010 TaxID=1121013 RepID=A0A091BD47_9GAMM|nr:MBL fold metallo-hydrolase [Arenimonas composti]KFN50593.1 hypothetical protein P873_05380 [Arenimonas composti TR7-09 = DSM 18010]